MSAKSKLELILELRNKLFNNKLMQTQKKFSQFTDTMNSKTDKLKMNHVRAFTAMRDQFPGFGRGLDLITNKFALFTAGAALLGGVLVSSVSHANSFNKEFLPIANLNLDKSKGELASYKDIIRDVAFDTGANLNTTAKAFYDVQSATGLFGKSAASVVKDVSNFSIATGADLNDSINATVKAMKAFGLSTKDIGAYLTSNAKTVQVGITTFAELSQVQTEYAGAAAGAGASVDTANKIFAAFTSIAKDSVAAANMTKTAFQGLTQESTIKGLKSIGISMYDSKGQMRDLSEVLEEVSGKFKDMQPKEIDELINKIGGPEGLRALFTKLKTSSKDFFDTLNAFDASKFDLNKALQNAQGDAGKLGEVVKNRWGVVMENLGQKILPWVAKGLDWINTLLVNGTKFYSDNKEMIDTIAISVVSFIGLLKSWRIAQWAVNVAMNANPIGLLIGLLALLVGAIVHVVNNWDYYVEKWTAGWNAVKAITSLAWESMSISFKMGWLQVQIYWNKLKGFFQHVGASWTKMAKVMKQALSGDLEGAAKTMVEPIVTSADMEVKRLEKEQKRMMNEHQKNMATNTINAIKYSHIMINKPMSAKKSDSQKQLEAMAEKANGQGGLIGDDGAGAGVGTADKTAEDITKVTGAGAQVKNITVNIDAFNKGGINTANTTLAKMDAAQIEGWFNEMLMRTIRNLELSQ